MRAGWLRRAGSDRVAVLFGGWGIGPGVFAPLGPGPDLVFVRDWRGLDAALPDLGGYAWRGLLAWSFGVAAYGHWQAGQPDPFDRRVAVCGTLAPVDRRRGIPPAVVEGTRRGLTPDSFAAFRARALGGQPSQPGDEPSFDMALDLPALQDELAAVATRGPAPDPGFDRIWIAGQDRIFPPANQRAAWAGTGGVQEIDAPHAPFAALGSWQAVFA